MTLSVACSARAWFTALALLIAPVLALAQGGPSAEEERKLQAERERINVLLLEIGKLIQQSETDLNAVEATLKDLDGKERELRGALEQRHDAISALLAALQRMGRNPPPVMITRREDALTMVRSAMLLSSGFPALKEQAAGLTKELKSLEGIIQSKRAERKKQETKQAQLDAARVKLAALQDQKRRSGPRHAAEMRQEVARIAEGANVKEVSDLLQRLDQIVADRAPQVAVLAPSGERRAMLAPGPFKPNIPFEQAKGTLQLPSQGRRTISFGQKNHLGIQSKGIGIQTRYGGTVFAPCDGTIVYAGEFRTYGQLLIINPGGGYHILLAGLSQIDVQVGQSVLMGEPVGAMSSAAKSQAAAQDGGGPVLTVEFRKDQRPIDPDPWWSDGSRKVQG